MALRVYYNSKGKKVLEHYFFFRICIAINFFSEHFPTLYSPDWLAATNQENWTHYLWVIIAELAFSLSMSAKKEKPTETTPICWFTLQIAYKSAMELDPAQGWVFYMAGRCPTMWAVTAEPDSGAETDFQAKHSQHGVRAS